MTCFFTVVLIVLFVELMYVVSMDGISPNFRSDNLRSRQSMAVFTPVLNLKGYKKGYARQNGYTKHYRQSSYHCSISFLSSGVTKYATKEKIANITPVKIYNNRSVLPDNIPPITPAVSVYLAASAKTFPITFLRSLFTDLSYHTEKPLTTKGRENV